jgi:hypothetical protein
VAKHADSFGAVTQEGQLKDNKKASPKAGFPITMMCEECANN